MLSNAFFKSINTHFLYFFIVCCSCDFFYYIYNVRAVDRLPRYHLFITEYRFNLKALLYMIMIMTMIIVLLAHSVSQLSLQG